MTRDMRSATMHGEVAVDNAIDEKEYCKVALRRTSLSEQIFGYLLSITRGIRKPERLVLRSEHHLRNEKKKTNQLIACSAHHGESGIKFDT